MTYKQLSVYVLLVQALRNEVNKILSVGDGDFDAVLGEGARAEVANLLPIRFNMDDGWEGS